MMERQARLAVFLATSGHSGVDRVMKNLLEAFSKRGIRVDVLKIENHGPYFDRELPGVRIVNLGVSHINSSLLPLVRYLKQERPQTLLCDKDRVNRIAIWARHLARVPTTVAVRIGTTVSVNLARRSWFKRQMQYFSMKRFYPRADCILMPSQGAADDLVRITGLSREKIKVVPSPVVGDNFSQMASMPVDHPWFTPREIPIVLGVGELCARKDFSTLIEAFAIVHAQRPCRLIILGEGRQREKLQRLIERLNLQKDVSMPGFVSNPYAFMSRSNVFVLSSNCEGAPVVLMEALAAGVPAVSTNCPSGPEEILQNGRVGKLVPVGDAAAMAQAIVSTLDDPPDKRLLTSAAENYFISTSASRYLEALGVDNRKEENPTQ